MSFETEKLLARVSSLEGRLNTSGNNLGNSASSGTTSFYNTKPNGQVYANGGGEGVSKIKTAVAGIQSDGSYGVQHLDGPVPPAPTGVQFTMVGINKEVRVTWDGSVKGGKLPGDFEALEVRQVLSPEQHTGFFTYGSPRSKWSIGNVGGELRFRPDDDRPMSFVAAIRSKAGKYGPHVTDTGLGADAANSTTYNDISDFLSRANLDIGTMKDDVTRAKTDITELELTKASRSEYSFSIISIENRLSDLESKDDVHSMDINYVRNRVSDLEDRVNVLNASLNGIVDRLDRAGIPA